MFKEFQIRREVVLNASPDTVFDAVSTGTAGWLFPKTDVPAVGGAGADDPTVRTWEPGEHLVVQMEGADGYFNNLDYDLARDGGSTLLRYEHRTCVEPEEWDTQFAMCDKHTDFYMHTLGQYVEHFPGGAATYISVDGNERSADLEALGTIRQALRLTDAVVVGDSVQIDIPGLETVDGVLDFQNDNFIGLRSDTALYRIFGRGAWGFQTGVTVHSFAENVDRAKAENVLQAWLDGLFD